MHDDLQAAIEDLVAEFGRQVHQVRETHAQLREVTATVSDGNVTVTAGPQGRIDEITFHPRVYSRLSPSELAQAVLDQVTKANAQVAEESRGLMAPLVPEGMAAEQLFGGEFDLDGLLPETPFRTPREAR
ncbi:YbaB/EbfC family nucleoid-associated protein [Nonomuraea guangzhouensis]|uniref:YbaB/EbfC family nucleoid-associated protein n=1 Tax=Nonomuraea guangzhouensis TaxID=1291555 RepID=A0ABW4GIG6_9ACTN|nr:YbaB/EbfC family nucleoid-associated protein [Nonomuraea guangzhouensis]